jgi:hypothetical protein
VLTRVNKIQLHVSRWPELVCSLHAGSYLSFLGQQRRLSQQFDGTPGFFPANIELGNNLKGVFLSNFLFHGFFWHPGGLSAHTPAGLILLAGIRCYP